MNNNRPPYTLLFLCATLPFWGNLYSFLPKVPLPFFEIILIFTKSFTLLAPFFFWKKLNLPSSWKYFSKHLGLQNNRTRNLVAGTLVGILMGAGIIASFEFLPEALQRETLSRIALKIETLHIKKTSGFMPFFSLLLTLCLRSFIGDFFFLRLLKNTSLALDIF